MNASVIVPLYNNEKYIERCLKSLLAQDCDDFEIIVVDDGSSDGSLAIARSYESERIKVFTKDNGGPSLARNFGITKCDNQSQWLMFVDSDDSVATNYVSTMLHHAASGRLVVCGMNHLREDCSSECPTISVQTSGTRTCRDFWGDSIFLEKLRMGIMNPACNKCYSLSVIRSHKLEFEKLLPEDIRFNLDYVKYCDEICFVDMPLYNYFHRQGSVSCKPVISLYDGYIRIQKELYDLVPRKYHSSVDEFVYPQYLANTRRYLRMGNYDIPRRYIRNDFVLRAISSHRPTSIGDCVVKLLFRFGFWRLLNII